VIRGGIRLGLICAAAAALALPAASAFAATGPPTLQLNAPKHPGLLDKVNATGNLPGAAPGEQVTIRIEASGREIESKKVAPAADGSFSFPFVIEACCNYEVVAQSGGQSSPPQRFSVSVPKHLSKGPLARLYNESLVDQGYYVGHLASRFSLGSRLATLAFRKVNHMRRTESYDPSIFRRLLMGQGAFDPRFDDGHHVEVDISSQVMALIDGDRPVATFHVSTGAGGTPTVRGNFHFYMKQPGYNAKRMYFSVYFIGGYATHGYNPVPTYNASHGCVRNPIPFSRYIYDWINIGDPMHVYG
jgi:lipoprotein-anchoring transpeptidase ErfK/SrfK